MDKPYVRIDYEDGSLSLDLNEGQKSDLPWNRVTPLTKEEARAVYINAPVLDACRREVADLFEREYADRERNTSG